MGAEGTKASSSKLALEFGIGKVAVNLYIKRVRKAILDLEQEHVVWPDKEEIERSKTRIKLKSGFQQCIGIIDGTLIVLHQRPHLYGDSYFSQKS